MAVGFLLLLWGAVKSGDETSKMGGFLMAVGAALIICSALILKG